jgi:hypothetical protein
MIKFQFDGDVDYFVIDPVAYAPALGRSGTATYRTRLSDIEAGLGPPPSAEDLWTSRHPHEWFMIEWNARRLAVFDRDTDAIISTQPADRKVAAWIEDTAEAFEEIGEIDLAIVWAKQGDRVRPRAPVAQGRRILVQAVGRASARRAAPGPPGGVPAVAVLKHSHLPLPGRGAVVAELRRRGGR